MTDLEKQAREEAANFAFIQRDDDKGDLWNAACDHIANAFRHEANPFGNLLAFRDAQPGEVRTVTFDPSPEASLAALAKPRPDREAVEKAAESIWSKRWFFVSADAAPDAEPIETDEPRRFAEIALLPSEDAQTTAGGSICITHDGKMICLPAADWIALAGPSEDGWREERERLRAALEYARNLLHLKGVQADEIDEALSGPKEQGEGK